MAWHLPIPVLFYQSTSEDNEKEQMQKLKKFCKKFLTKPDEFAIMEKRTGGAVSESVPWKLDNVRTTAYAK